MVKKLRQRFASPESRLAFLCGGAILIALLLVTPYRIAQSGYLTDVSGAWATLADDLTHGVLYRAPVSSLGYGGTRYFPLHIVLHGGLASLGMSLRFSGHLLSLASAAVLVWAGARVLRERGATPEWAWAGGLLTLASRTAFMAVSGIRGDLLAIALGVLGLALVPVVITEVTAILPASICLALALLAKPTLAWAPAGAFLALLVNRQFKSALTMAAIVGGLTGAGLVLAHVASHGQMLAGIRAFGSGGGFSFKKLLGSASFVRPGEAAWIVGGLVATLARGRKAAADPIGVAVVLCFAVTLALYTGEGIHINHLIDSVVVGCLALSISVVNAKSPRWPRLFWAIAAGLGVAEAILLDAMVLKRGELEAAAAAIPRGDKPILSEQPWIPILAGERVFMLDAFNLAHMRLASPIVQRDLLDRLDQCQFRAVVLIGTTHIGDWWYQKARFGLGFSEHLLANYSFNRIAGAHAIYLPHCGRPAPPATNETVESETVLERGGRPNLLKTWLLGTFHGSSSNQQTPDP